VLAVRERGEMNYEGVAEMGYVWTGERKQIDGGETSLSPLVYSRRMLVQVSTCKDRGWLERVAACVLCEGGVYWG
jgi:hypothetical protein